MSRWGAVVTRPKIMDSVFNSMERCVVHSNTFGQNDMAMAAALASLYVIEQDKLVENTAAMGALRHEAASPKSAKRVPVRPRDRWACAARASCSPSISARPKSGFLLQQKWDALHAMNFGVFGQTIIIPLLQNHRILTQVAGYHTEVIKFLPPMTITKADLDWFLNAMEQVLGETVKTGAMLKTMVKLGVGAVRA